MQRESVLELLEAVGLAIGLAAVIILFVAQSFLVQGHSMEPTLHNGERLLVDKLSYRFRSPERGEIVVFRVPTDPSRKFIKRIIGVPGDMLEFQGGRVLLNGRPLQESYARGPTQSQVARTVVPPGRYFVLGDNRLNSDDSRFDDVGFIPRDAIIGRALLIYWPLYRASLVQVPATFASAARP
ncbi:MAG: signal peptidase I [Limnochordaceae bacterium]|nr:signal peptidase I [Limnochordaceae bacterium]